VKHTEKITKKSSALKQSRFRLSWRILHYYLLKINEQITATASYY
jgi:hypothetical protein